MDRTRQHIVKIAGILRVLCQIASIALKILMIGSLVGIALVFLRPSLITELDSSVPDSNTFMFRFLDQNDILAGMEVQYIAAIALFLAFLSAWIYLIYVNFFRGFLGEIAQGEQPFRPEAGRRLRRQACLMLLLLLTSPLQAVILSLVTLLFSYLFDYGAYLQQRADETKRIQEEMILSFAEISENKSGQTGQHVRRVAEYSKILAEELGYGADEVERIGLASTMHDIGKLLIPSEILDKPGRLTDEEFKEMKLHTTYGGQLLDHVEGDIMGLAKTVALEHHERVDGRGYPTGIDGKDISIEGRIVAVADVYDALTSRRSYKDAWDHEEAYREIVANSGTQFDAEVVAAFQRAYDKINAVRQRYADGT